MDRRRTFKPARLAVEAFQGLHFLVSSELGFLHGRLHHPDGFIVDFERNRVGMAILAAMGQREACGILETVGRAMHDLGDHGERSDRARADTRRQEKLGEINGSKLGRGSEGAVQPSREDVTRSDVVVWRHYEMRKHSLRRRLSRKAESSETIRSGPRPLSSSNWAVREVSARLSVRFTISPWTCPSIALCGSSTKLLQILRVPMVAARLLVVAVHALLHDGPFAVIGHEEAVQVEIEAVLDGGAVDFGDKAARAGQLGTVETNAFAQQAQFVRRLPRMLASAAADMDAKLIRERSPARASGRRSHWS